MPDKDSKSAWKACKTSLSGTGQNQQVCEGVLSEGGREVYWATAATTVKTSSVPAIPLLFEALKKHSGGVWQFSSMGKQIPPNCFMGYRIGVSYGVFSTILANLTSGYGFV
jgi:hypothetical protein